MSVAELLARGRQAALLLMTDTVKVTRDGARVWDENTGKWGVGLVTVYQGPGKLMMPSTAVSRAEAQGQIVTLQEPTLKLPIDAPAEDGVTGDPGDVTTDDVAEVLASITDPALVSRKVKLGGLALTTNATQRRFPVQAVS